MVSRGGARQQGRRGGSPRGQFDENLFEPYRVQIQSRCNDVRFMMWEFKIKMCNRMDVHEWTQCPHAHIGEKLARRDFLKTKYFPKACENMKNNKHCPKGDGCQKAHNVFELWLHPNKYRTEFCTNKNNCTRALCFFAHNDGEKRKHALEEFQAELLRKHLYTNESFDSFKSQFSGVACKDEYKTSTPTYNPYYCGVFEPVKQVSQYNNAEKCMQQLEDKNLDNDTLNMLLQQALVEINTRERIIHELQNQGALQQQFGNSFEEFSYSSQSTLNDMSQGSFRDGTSSNCSYEGGQVNLQMCNLNPFASSFLNMQRQKSEEIYSDAMLENKLGQDLVRCLSK